MFYVLGYGDYSRTNMVVLVIPYMLAFVYMHAHILINLNINDMAVILIFHTLLAFSFALAIMDF